MSLERFNKDDITRLLSYNSDEDVIISIVIDIHTNERVIIDKDINIIYDFSPKSPILKIQGKAYKILNLLRNHDWIKTFYFPIYVSTATK